jgi:PGF-CTERM protein
VPVVNSERALAGLAVGLVVVMALAAPVLPGALADREGPVRPSVLDLRPDVSVAPGEVTGESATLSLEMRLSHRGGPANNVTVEVRAVDAETNLRATTETVAIGTIDGDREVTVTTNVTVPRAGGYEFEVFVYQDGERIESGTTTVNGVGALTPDYRRTPVQFETFDGAGPPSVSYSIANVSGGQVELATTTYLTNTGDEPVDDLTVQVTARQAESNIVADRTTVTVGEIRPGRTAGVEATLTVPDDYNYRLDAILERDDVLLGVTSANAELAPTQPMPENVTRREIDISASDFTQGTRDAAGDGPIRETTAAAGPGFGVTVALVTLLAGTLLYIRRKP